MNANCNQNINNFKKKRQKLKINVIHQVNKTVIKYSLSFYPNKYIFIMTTANINQLVFTEKKTNQ